MAEDWLKFSQQVVELAKESEDLEKKRDELDRRVFDAQIVVEELKSESKGVTERLVQLQEEQKVASLARYHGLHISILLNYRQALMGSFHPAATPKSAITAISPRLSKVEQPLREQTNRECHQPRDTSNIKSESEGNDNLRPKDLYSTPDSLSANEDAPPFQPPYKVPPPTLVTTCATAPNDFWFQIARATRPIHADFPSVVNMDGKWVEISCGVCGVNARHKEGVPDIYKGIMGLHNHIKSAHGDEVGRSPWECVKAIKRRAVGDDDVDAMLDGREPAVKITSKSWKKPRLSPKTQENNTPGSIRKRAYTDMQPPTKSTTSLRGRPKPSMRQQEGALARKLERAKTGQDDEELIMQNELFNSHDDHELIT